MVLHYLSSNNPDLGLKSAPVNAGVWSLAWEDPWEKEMATHSNILAWEIPWTEEPGGLQSMGRRAGHDLATKQQQPLGMPERSCKVL